MPAIIQVVSGSYLTPAIPAFTSGTAAYAVHNGSHGGTGFGVQWVLSLQGAGLTFDAGGITGGTITALGYQFGTTTPGTARGSWQADGFSLGGAPLRQALELGGSALEAMLAANGVRFGGAGGGDAFRGGAAADTLMGFAGDDLLFGEAGDDMLFGQDGADALLGGVGADFVAGGTGADSVWGGADADYIMGEEGEDFLNGEAGDDVLVGGSGLNDLRGGAGSDGLFGGSGLDYFSGGAGRDFFYAHHEGLHADGQEFVMDFGAGGEADYLVLAASARAGSRIFEQDGYTWIESPVAGGAHFIAILGDVTAATLGDRVIWV